MVTTTMLWWLSAALFVWGLTGWIFVALYEDLARRAIDIASQLDSERRRIAAR